MASKVAQKCLDIFMSIIAALTILSAGLLISGLILLGCKELFFRVPLLYFQLFVLILAGLVVIVSIPVLVIFGLLLLCSKMKLPPFGYSRRKSAAARALIRRHLNDEVIPLVRVSESSNQEPTSENQATSTSAPNLVSQNPPTTEPETSVQSPPPKVLSTFAKGNAHNHDEKVALVGFHRVEPEQADDQQPVPTEAKSISGNENKPAEGPLTSTPTSEDKLTGMPPVAEDKVKPTLEPSKLDEKAASTGISQSEQDQSNLADQPPVSTASLGSFGSDLDVMPIDTDVESDAPLSPAPVTEEVAIETSVAIDQVAKKKHKKKKSTSSKE